MLTPGPNLMAKANRTGAWSAAGEPARGLKKIGGGMNPAFKRGDQFIKPVTRNGSPYAEEAVSKGFSLLGVPHSPSKRIELPTGQQAVTSKFIHMTPLNFLGQGGDTSQREWLQQNKDAHVNTLLAEWLHSVSDRHGHNYVFTPQHGIISIDHGMALHPGTYQWPKLLLGEPLKSELKLAGEPFNWSERPDASALRSLVYSPYDERPQGRASDDVVQKALSSPDQLEALAHEGTHGLPDEERDMAKMAMRVRLEALKRHLALVGHVDHPGLHVLHNKALALAQSTFGRRV